MPSGGSEARLLYSLNKRLEAEEVIADGLRLGYPTGQLVAG